MNKKLIATLVASTLQFYALQAQAQAACEVAGTATTASATSQVTSGPLNPVDGFPEWVQDANGNQLQRCLDANICFFDPIVTTDAFSMQIGSGGEAFYWSADAVVNDGLGNRVLTLGMAAETAFLQEGPNAEPLDGSQFPFLRLRFVMGVPVDGTYTVKHPYGSDVFTVTAATGARDVFSTVDRGFAPNSGFVGPVGPFMKSLSAPAGYMGDIGISDLASGAPCHTDASGNNFVEVSGVDVNGNPVVFAGGLTVLRTGLFSVQGRLYDGKVQTPLVPTRVTYSRSTDGSGQIDTFAVSSIGAAVTVKDGPTIPAGSSRLPTPVALDKEGTVSSLSARIANASALPPILSLRAADDPAVADPTELNQKLVDFVDISRADYDVTSGILMIAATSSDKVGNPALALRDFGSFTSGDAVMLVPMAVPPAVVHVDSAAGGSASAAVRVTSVAPPADFSLLQTSGATARTLTMDWSNDANRAGVRVFQVNADGSESLLLTVGSVVTHAVLTGLTPATSYQFRVEAFNAGGSVSRTVSGSTLALPAAVASVSAQLSSVAQRTLEVSWAASADPQVSGYQVYRSVAAGAYTLVSGATPLAGTVTSFADTGGAPSTAYSYQVVAVRDLAGQRDLSAPTSSTALTTPAAPTSASQPLATVSGNTVVLAWTDRATNETAYQVYRRLGTGAYAPVSAVLAANTSSFADSALANGTYNYRVDVSNWAGTVQSAVSANVVVSVLTAATDVTATSAVSPVVRWKDTVVGETAYRVRRSTYTIGATGTATAGAFAALTNAAAVAGTGGTGTTTDSTATRDRLVRYEVAPLNGATVGPVTLSDFAISTNGGIPAVATTTLTRSLVGTAPNQTARVTVGWGALTHAAVGGYEVQRCAGAACTDFTKVTGAAVNTDGTVDRRATVTFVDNTVARATTYRYRIRAVTGGKLRNAGAPIAGAFGPVTAVTTQ